MIDRIGGLSADAGRRRGQSQPTSSAGCSGWPPINPTLRELEVNQLVATADDAIAIDFDAESDDRNWPTLFFLRSRPVTDRSNPVRENGTHASTSSPVGESTPFSVLEPYQ